jgi:uncharacterized membrane protein (UPF0182 family)
MKAPSRARSKAAPAVPELFTRLATSRNFLRGAATRVPTIKRWGIRLVAVAAALVVLWLLFVVAVQVITSHMWFDSVHNGSVYTTMLQAKVVLFCVFGGLAGVVGGLTIVALRRIAPLYLSPDDDTFRWLFRTYERRVWPLIVLLAVVIPGIRVGQRAAGRWQTFLLWRHAVPWHATDPVFHKDISFFIDVYPFHAMVVSLLSQAVSYGLWIAVIGGYWYGTWRLRRGRQKITPGIAKLASLLLAAYLALKAVGYWVSRYGLTTSPRGPVTGAGYTDLHAALPSKYVLMAIAVVCAVALLANALLVDSAAPTGVLGRLAALGRVRLLGGVLVLMLVASTVIGSVWPQMLYHYRESPSTATLDRSEISHNLTSTMAAFGLDGNVTTIPSAPAANRLSDADLVRLAGKTAQVSLIDPNQLSPTFNVEQQLQAYYQFKSTLDTSHYDLNGRHQDVALAVRELQSSGIPKSSWVNNHLVYTHGYGLVAAPTTKVDPKTQNPVFLDGGMPPSQEIPVTRPQIYFGQGFGPSSYSIVGQPAGGTQKLELDHPGGKGPVTSTHTTYQGHGGIPIGSPLRRLLFAVQMHSPNFLFSAELNSASQLLTVRNPRARVAKIAPWLTLDGDVYPAVVNGKIKWIVDGYTTSSNYPDSQLVNMHTASATTLTTNGASVSQSNSGVNYLQNSVKAVVDAYTGQVTLYEWNQQQHPDPLLKTWESVFPGLVKPQTGIGSNLLSQLRYPTDLFNVQRYLLAKYHVTSPTNFYSGNDFWAVPSDPTIAASNGLNATSASGSSAPLPSRYMSMSPDGYGHQQYSLSSPMVTLNGRQLAAFVYVSAQPGPDYGKFTVLEFPSGSGGESPSQVQNDIESNTAITKALTLQRGGNSRVVLGVPETIPLAGRMLYVEPVYTQSSGGSSFPILRHVIALYGNGDPSFDNSVGPAIKDAIRSAGSSGRSVP